MLASPPEAAAAAPDDAASFAARLGADARAMADLEEYRRRLIDGAARFNLVGPSAFAQFWPRHAFDSAQLLLFAPEARGFVDLGSGAGFPGLVLAILLRRRGGHVHLFESVSKRCGFLREVIAALDLPAQVHHLRAEAAAPVTADVVTARACAPLPRLLGYAETFLNPNNRALFLKGRNAETEVASARRLWRFDVELLPSLSDPEGRVVSIRGLSRG